ncbi:hypothetical protein OSB04_000713 [Centaurea solstitialis]|uniref:Uncharacterized protein n=1 Tax=Centaurea solstitialis TaxID=347529 RepID=A0AA38U7Z1_9ASTR|nr:hypothetical protein OSB04_000713 [Centaurea solstitialis]
MTMRWFFGWETVVVFYLFMISLITPVTSQPQTNLLLRSCSLLNATNTRSFFNNLNQTFAEVRRQLSNNNTFFATGEQARSLEPVYVMAQCRHYMSTAECLACYDYATSTIRACAAADGARAVLDGCFLRYETTDFYDDATQPGNVGLCGNRTAIRPTRFQTAVDGLLSNLTTATPRIKDLFAASSSNITGSNRSVFAIAQCVPTLAHNGCKDCLRVAYSNIRNCLPNIVDARALDTGCFMRYSNAPFFNKNETTIITPFLEEGNSSKKGAIIGGVVGGVGLLSIIVVVAILMWHCRSKKKMTPRGNLAGSRPIAKFHMLAIRDLRKATKNFCDDYKLGEGGFGDVYKGTIKNGNLVAVKKLLVSNAKADFEREVRVISNVHHRNLIRLLGCCSEGTELLLVLEYMENGSLANFLYGERKGTLTWKQRCSIIFGVAKGLAYLHEQYHVTIIHRDINPSNILLDNEFQPKIADFGLARLLPEDQTHISTRFAGTCKSSKKITQSSFYTTCSGYTAPEYAIHGQLSEKADTYSFGIVVLEIISGKRCTDILSPPDRYLLEHAMNVYENHTPLQLIDETLDPSEYTENEVNKMIEIALLCTMSPVSERPTMSEVLVHLNDRSREQRPPTRLRFDVPNLNSHVDDQDIASSVSNAGVSLTELTGR